VLAVQVAEGPGPGASERGGVPAWLRFDESDLEGPGQPLGYMIENGRMLTALNAALETSGVKRIEARVEGVVAGPHSARLLLSDGAEPEAALVVGAEGRRSAVREAAGIRTWGWDYPQSGVAVAVALGRPHQGVAHQYFLKGGPLAVLPLTHQRASLVWTETRAAADALVAASDEVFEAHLSRRFGEFLGRPKLAGKRERFPLSLQSAAAMIGPRTALIGDAAHAVHPIAGQGLNLGLKDVAALAEVVVEARRLGEDWGSPAVLERYARWRRFDVMGALAGTELFARVFTGGGIARRVRAAGLSLVGKSASARRFFTREATATLGDAPRLLRGEPL
jgi:2-octaprenyl-6-methoxyphenol hydroxylase